MMTCPTFRGPPRRHYASLRKPFDPAAFIQRGEMRAGPDALHGRAAELTGDPSV